MPPKFSLQSVLDFRHSRVDALELEFSKLLTAQQEKTALLESLRNLHTNLCAQLQEKQVGDVDLFMVRHLHTNINQVQEGISLVTTDLRELERQLEAKRLELVTARQAEETLGTLKNHEIERYQVEQNRQENVMQDDLYISRIYRLRHQEV
jgi:flagellar export protein FliJ